jgi:hypothetical protein
MYKRNSLVLPLGLTAALVFACVGCGASSGQMSPAEVDADHTEFNFDLK